MRARQWQACLVLVAVCWTVVVTAYYFLGFLHGTADAGPSQTGMPHDTTPNALRRPASVSRRRHAKAELDRSKSTTATTTQTGTTEKTISIAVLPHNSTTVRKSASPAVPVDAGQRYRFVARRSKGHSSRLWEGWDTVNNHAVALKCIKQDWLEETTKHADQVRNEAAAMQLLEACLQNSTYQQFVMASYGDMRTTHRGQCFVLEPAGQLADGSVVNLKELLLHKPPKSAANLRLLIYQMVAALAAIHKDCSSSHADIKPKNYMLFGSVEECQQCLVANHSLCTQCQVKLIDLGSLFSPLTQNELSVLRTCQYRAPEVLLNGNVRQLHDQGTDMWALACSVYELTTQSYLFKKHTTDKHEQDRLQLAQIVATFGPVPLEVLRTGTGTEDFYDNHGAMIEPLPEAKSLHERLLADRPRWMSPDEARALAEFLQPMLVMDAGHRVTAVQALSHPYLQQEAHNFGMQRKPGDVS